MKSRVILSALCAGLILASTSNASAFGLFDRVLGSSCCEAAEPTCGCAPVSGCGGRRQRLRDRSCCEPTCGVEATCGCEPVAPTCGCEPAAPSCGCEPTCCKQRKTRCGDGLLKKLMSRGNSCCDEAPSCGCEPEPACGCEPAAPSCGFEPTCCKQRKTRCCGCLLKQLTSRSNSCCYSFPSRSG